MINEITTQLNNISIHNAVHLWFKNKQRAIRKYGHISNWDTSGVTNMSKLFFRRFSFNENISSWNVSNVTDMSDMFCDAESFNQDIGRWNVSSVTNMSDMFNNAESFNQDIGLWDVSNVVDMQHMFLGATEFCQNICKWNFIHREHVNFITNTLLETRLNGNSCFNRISMEKIFRYDRRKNFLLFLVRYGFVPYNRVFQENTFHKIFSNMDMRRSIMSFL